ncbi:serine dehydratase subunit alpha family protein, partial [Bittarella massiliensis]|nr:serine dehydratase subunit alpha family protein [Bittarella massiliensis (ex Durand et al. 2017)]
FAAAKAREVLGEFPEQMAIHCSGNIIKNVKSVTVPKSGGMHGIEAAALLGLIGGDAGRELEVLEKVTD